MHYPNIRKAVFVNRPNRFIADVLIDGKRETVHVKNTGRCKELLVPGCTVYLTESDNPGRKTRYDLISVEKPKSDGNTLLVNIDSQVPNDVAGEWLPSSGLFSENALFFREHTHGNSRFDFMIQDADRTAFLEVKGCTLENEDVCMFPDAPTQRGVKHLQELEHAVSEGYDAFLLFIVQMNGMKYLVPNDTTHPEFGNALRSASTAGVRIIAVECDVSPGAISACDEIPVRLQLI